jgi:hypothetical protein
MYELGFEAIQLTDDEKHTLELAYIHQLIEESEGEREFMDDDEM